MSQTESHLTKTTTYEKGREYERLAGEYLTGKGFQIRERNFRTIHGEIDIIARIGKEYHFIEVKGQRKDWQSEFKINGKKRKRIWNASVDYIQKNGLEQSHSFHYDVIIITGQKVKHYENAFEG